MLEGPTIAERIPVLTPSSRVTLLPFTTRPEGADYLVSVPARDLYFAIPAIGVEILRLLDAGCAITEITQQLGGTSETGQDSQDSVDSQDGVDADDDYDVADFVQNLLECGAIAMIDNIPVASAPQAPRDRGIELFPRLHGSYLRWITSPVFICLDVALVALAAVLLWRFPMYWPTSANFFVHPWYALNTLIILATALPLVFLHEFGHLCAARAEGVDGRLSLGRRLFTVVTQFHVVNIWQAPRRRRILIYLAGMAMNLRIFVVALALRVWFGASLPHTLAAWLGLVMILELTATLWQFQFFMKTDVYFLVADVVSVPTLMEDGRAYIGHLIQRLFGRARNTTSQPRLRLGAIRLYAIFYTVGVAIASFIFFIYALPFAIGTIGGSLRVLGNGPSIGVARFSDAIVTVLLYSINFGLLLWFWVRWPRRSSTSRRNA